MKSCLFSLKQFYTGPAKIDRSYKIGRWLETTKRLKVSVYGESGRYGQVAAGVTGC